MFPWWQVLILAVVVWYWAKADEREAVAIAHGQTLPAATAVLPLGAAAALGVSIITVPSCAGTGQVC